jgi:hypothetical protein
MGNIGKQFDKNQISRLHAGDIDSGFKRSINHCKEMTHIGSCICTHFAASESEQNKNGQHSNEYMLIPAYWFM